MFNYCVALLSLSICSQVIWLGDFNYRIYLPHTTTRSLVQKKEWNILLERDQVYTKTEY